jgi:hypothetical protein
MSRYQHTKGQIKDNALEALLHWPPGHSALHVCLYVDSFLSLSYFSQPAV